LIEKQRELKRALNEFHKDNQIIKDQIAGNHGLVRAQAADAAGA